jgi:hypothetical protein
MSATRLGTPSNLSTYRCDLALSILYFASIEVAAGTAQIQWHRWGACREIELADCYSPCRLRGTDTKRTRCSCASGCYRLYSEQDSVLLHAQL